MKKGKALFIIHDVYQDFNALPLGPAYLASMLRNDGNKVEIFNQDVFHQTNEELVKFLDDNSFDMIGLGFLSARYAETVRPLSKIISDHKKDAKFIIGGHGATAIPEYSLRDTGADIAMLGEGEETISPLMKKIISGEDYSNMRGIAVNKNGDIRVNPRQIPTKKLDDLPFPAWDLFPIDNYSTSMHFVGSENNEKH